MKTKLTLVLFLALMVAGKLQAQMTAVDAANSVAGSSDFGSIISNIANGIKPEAFKDSWNSSKTGWMDKLKSVKVGDIPAYGKLAGELVSNLKSSSFSKGFDVKSLLSSLNSSKDGSSLAGSLSSLTKGLDKSALTDDFAKNMDTFNAGLDMMKK